MTPAEEAAAAARRMPWMAAASVLAVSTIGLSLWAPWNNSAVSPNAPSIDKASTRVRPSLATPTPTTMPTTPASAPLALTPGGP